MCFSFPSAADESNSQPEKKESEEKEETKEATEEKQEEMKELEPEDKPEKINGDSEVTTTQDVSA